MIKISVYPALEKLAKAMVNDVDGAVHAGMINLVETLEAKAVKGEKAHVRTSNLINGISSFVIANVGTIRASAKSKAGVDYASYVHDGTGLYGPNKARIVPKTKKALNIPGIGVRRSVKGFKGRPFFDLALLDTNPQREFDKGVSNFLKAKGW